MNVPGLTLGPRRAPPPDDESEAELWRTFKASNAPDDRERLFSLYFPFARQIARRRFLDRKSGDIEFQDLCQLAYTGLLEAIDRYDPMQGTPFKAYALRRISGAVLDGLAKMSEMREQISFRNRVRRDRVGSLVATGADQMSGLEAMEALIDAAVGLALGFMLEGTSLVVDSGDASTLPGAYESAIWKEAVHRLGAEIHNLPAREQAVIRQHYQQGLQFDQIAAVMGLTKGRVSQIHKSALTLLKKRLSRAGDFKLER